MAVTLMIRFSLYLRIFKRLDVFFYLFTKVEYMYHYHDPFLGQTSFSTFPLTTFD